MSRCRRRPRRGFTAVELVVVVLLLSATISMTTWWLGRRQRAQLTSEAINSPGTLFDFECGYVEEPDRTESIVCTISNPNAFALPLVYRANSFFEQREGESYDGLPITSYPPREIDPITGEFRSIIPAGESIAVTLFSEFPIRKGQWTIVMKPAQRDVSLIQNVQVSSLPPPAAASPGGVQRIRLDTFHVLTQPETKMLHFDERSLVFRFAGNKP